MRFIYLSALLLTLMESAWAQDEVTWYQIELIVFENTDYSSADRETWPDDPGYPNLTRVIELIPEGPLEHIDDANSSLSAHEPRQAMAVDIEDASQTTDQFTGLSVDQRFDDAIATEDLSTSEDADLQPVVEETPFVLLPSQAKQLTQAARKLKRSQKYNVLLHIAWRQPITKGASPQRIHLHSNTGDVDDFLHRREGLTPQEPFAASNLSTSDNSGLSFGDSEDTGFTTFSAASDGTPLLIGDETDLGISNMAFLEPPSILDGSVAISLSRYLHLGADLVFHREVTHMVERVSPPPIETDLITVTENGSAIPVLSTEQEAASAPLEPEIVTRFQPYRLTDSRRMRSKEIHYIDHPVIGIIAQIIPYELPTAEETLTEDDASSMGDLPQ